MRDPEDNLSGLTLENLQEEFSVNIFSPLFAAGEAVKWFKQLPDSVSKTFIFTGNALNKIINPGGLTFAMGKTSIARMISYASVAYQNQGLSACSLHLEIFRLITFHRFYYADERQPNGGPTIPVSGPAAARAYVELAEDKAQRNPLYTVVDGRGYVDFGIEQQVVYIK